MPELANGFAEEPSPPSDPVNPSFPKSLYILQPLFSTYALNPVAEEAQAIIRVPDGLDLNAWIVPRAKPASPVNDEYEQVGDLEKKLKKKSKKGKERDDGEGTKIKKTGKRPKDDEGEAPTQEQRADAEARALVRRASAP